MKNQKAVNSDKFNSIKYLYHYTSASTLEKILQSGCIRFNNLTHVNDLKEMETQDLGKFGKYCLVSCWTNLESESLWHWQTYASMNGVRIGLPINPFDETFNVYKHVCRGGYPYRSHFNVIDNSVIEKLSKLDLSKIPFDELMEIMSDQPYPELLRISYTDTEWMNVPSMVIAGSYDEATINGDMLGRCKEMKWSKESEYRYRLLLRPNEYSKREVIPAIDADDFNIYWLSHFNDYPTIDHIDYPISKECMDDIKVLIGPSCSAEEKEHIRSVICNSCENASIAYSSLSGQ